MHPCKTFFAVVLLLALAHAAAAQDTAAPSPATAPAAPADQGTTSLIFKADFPVGLYQISALFIEPSGKTLDSNITITNKKMELLAVSPASLNLPNGDYTLNIGGIDEFNRMLVLKATGGTQTISVHGDPAIARTAGIITSILGITALICAPNVNTMVKTGQPDVWGIVALCSGGLTIAGGVVWIVNAPWIAIE